MAERKLTCLLMGDESLLIQCAETLRSRGHALVGIVTGEPSVARWAGALGIPVHAPGKDLPARLEAARYEWLFSIANLRIVPEALWRKASRGALNFHDGPLPRYAGLNAPAWAILAGEKTHGVTWHAITAGIDEGDIYAQRTFALAPDETALTLNTKCYEAAIESFTELVRGLESETLVPVPQDLGARTYFGKHDRPEAAATLRFDRPAAELDALVRALDYGAGYANPLLVPKLRTKDGLHGVTSLEIVDAPHGSAAPGEVLAVDERGAVIATADRSVRLRRIVRTSGEEVPAAELLAPGMHLPLVGSDEAARLDAMMAEVAKCEDFFAARLESPCPPELPGLDPAPPGSEAPIRRRPIDSAEARSGGVWAAAIAAYLLRTSGPDRVDLALRTDALASFVAEAPGHFASAVPLRADAADDPTFGELAERVGRELETLERRRTYPADLPARRPRASATHPVGLVITAKPETAAPVPGTAATFVVPADGKEALLLHDVHRLAPKVADALVARLERVLDRLDPHARVRALPLMTDDERKAVLEDANRTERAYEAACIDELFERQVDATPDATALVFLGETLTYRELDRRANALARALVAAGVGPDALVGLSCRRSPGLVIAALAIHKAGGAYVPLDPAYPTDRLAFMLEDSGAKVLVTERALLDSAQKTAAMTLCVDEPALDALEPARLGRRASPSNLAYVIYTSGSTGTPKGVMVEHRNVAAFFAGMDERIARDPGTRATWLAVTSLSFDISVLELFYTLCRGFRVVLGSDEERTLRAGGAVVTSARPMDFGLFYWGNDDGHGARKYRLLLEGARFADAHGFHAIWTPERHFHAFGGPYPNPSVTGAAVAAITERLQIRAGSCVLPLHHPARVAEEWAVLDNLSHGRVGLAFASGWMPEDFLLRPESAPPNNKHVLLRDMEVVRRLWRGEAVSFETPAGAMLDVVTQPRPVQRELPVWVTTAGNPETYRDAARLGANVLTHLLGQSIAELEGKITIYREALREAGRDPATFRVTLMLHTLVGDDREAVRELARGPMKAYLRSAAALIKQYAWAFPAFKKPAGAASAMDIDLKTLDPSEMDAILEFAFLRYFDESGLFGTVEECAARVDALKRIGVDEIACLIDFGVDTDVVLERLAPLAEVVRRTSRPTEATRSVHEDAGLAAQIARWDVTHLQCTPSMLRMLAMNDETREALARVRHLFLGGEPLPGALVGELAALAPEATVTNMYGPTETTIWSSTHAATPCEGTVPLGQPIANTRFYVLDARREPVPPGMPGELYIAGHGVARGYLHRDALTRERFVEDPFHAGRMYRTGDLVRRDEDGTLHFLGRVDHQVKVRGHRIELGEIEARIAARPGVEEAVVVAREDAPGDVRLVAYLRGGAIDVGALREHLRSVLPEIMVPAHFVLLERFPLTPNAKVDRKALPKPEDVAQVGAAAEYTAPESDLERVVAEVYARVLGVARIGSKDNFFALGGHSLLAVQAHRELKAAITAEVTVTDIFRFPTVHALAVYLEDRSKAGEALDEVADRAAARREAMGRRGLRRARAASTDDKE